jgi:2-polyprenyl-3-methyl-5-hydroxy-6-metoxy-1,4-benzoquinol methylase
MTAFPKYLDAGAYHWGKLDGRGIGDYHARLHARYGWFVAQCPSAPDGRVIDVGCGDAALSHLLAIRTRRPVTGIEPETEGVEAARAVLASRNSTVAVIQGTGEHLPFAAGEASVVTLCEVVEHVAEPDAVLREAWRVLRRGGMLLLSTPHAQDELADPLHAREYSAAEVRQQLASWLDVAVHVAEPAWLVEAYTRPVVRRVVNAAALTGRNPFARLREPAARRRHWRQVYATARKA